MFRFRVLFFALVLVVIGCGGQSSDEDMDGGSNLDAKSSETGADRGTPPPADGPSSNDADAPPIAVDVTRDMRDAGELLDGFVDRAPIVDVSADGRDADPARDAVQDAEDATEDTADARDTSGDGLDASTDVPVDQPGPVFDVADAPPTIDAGIDAGVDAPSVVDVAGTDVMDANAGVDNSFDVTPDAGDGCASCGLVSLMIVPPNITIMRGNTQQLRAWGTYWDSTTREVTTDAYWTSTIPSTAVASNSAGAKGLVTAMHGGMTIIEAVLGGISGATSVTVISEDPVSLAITPVTPSLPLGIKLPFTATMTHTDGSTQDVTSLVAWSSSAPSMASIDMYGVATGLTPGGTTITASISSMSASTLLTVTSVTLVSLTVAPSQATLPVGVVKSLIATGHFSDASSQDLTAQTTWTSSDGTRAAVDDTAGLKGRLTALAPGTTTITAALGAISGTAAIDVSTASLQSITIALPSPHLVLRMDLPLRATGHYSDGSTADLSGVVTWASLDSSVAPVSVGRVYAAQEGATSITASYQSVVASMAVDVRAAALVSIDLAPLNPTLTAHASVSMQATGHYSDGTTFDLTTLAIWTTSAPAIASVGNIDGSRGVVTGLTPGSSSIGAAYAGAGANTTATVTP